jgi:hypothetical protein
MRTGARRCRSGDEYEQLEHHPEPHQRRQRRERRGKRQWAEYEAADQYFSPGEQRRDDRPDGPSGHVANRIAGRSPLAALRGTLRGRTVISLPRRATRDARRATRDARR